LKLLAPLETLTRNEPLGFPNAPPCGMENCVPAGPSVITAAAEISSDTGIDALPADVDTVTELK
jgi:hypothetical protein